MDKLFELLKAIFGDKTISFEDFKKGLEDKKDEIKLVNLKDGAYVDKAKLDKTLEENKTLGETIKQNAELIKKFDGVDLEKLKADYEGKLTAKDAEVEKIRKDHSIKAKLAEAGVHSVKAVYSFLDLDAIKVKDDDVLGLSEQIEKLKTSEAHLFKEPPKEPNGKQSSEGSGAPGVKAKMGFDHKTTPQNAGLDAKLAAAAGLKAPPQTTT